MKWTTRVIAASAALLAWTHTSASAAIVPTFDDRSVEAVAELFPLGSDNQSEFGLANPFSDSLVADLSNVDGSAHAEASHTSSYTPGGLYFSGSADVTDSFYVGTGGFVSSQARSRFYLEFSIEAPTDYTLSADGSGFDTFVLARNAPSLELLIGSFVSASSGTLPPGDYYVDFGFFHDYFQDEFGTSSGGSSGSGAVEMTFVPTIPEPGTLTLGTCGLVAMMAVGRGRARSRQPA